MKWLTRKMCFIFLRDELIAIAREARKPEDLNKSLSERLSSLSKKNGMLDALEILGLLADKN